MRPFRKSSIVAAALAIGVVSGVWAQGEWKAPADAKNTKNPLAAKKGDAKVLADAKKLAEQNCATCHGPSATGDAPAAAALPPPKPADWTSTSLASETDRGLWWNTSTARAA